jgi:hypothetical protein
MNTSKKIFFGLGLLAIVSFSSCRKNRTCNCVTTIVSGDETTQTQKDNIILDVNKDEGTEACAKLESVSTFPGFKETVVCNLNN